MAENKRYYISKTSIRKANESLMLKLDSAYRIDSVRFERKSREELRAAFSAAAKAVLGN